MIVEWYTVLLLALSSSFYSTALVDFVVILFEK